MDNNITKKAYTLTLAFRNPDDMERFLRLYGKKAIWSGGSINSGDTLLMPATTDDGQITLSDYHTGEE